MFIVMCFCLILSTNVVYALYISYIMLELYYLSSSVVVIFFFKQKTAYEMRISDWSSDVCSSDLAGHHFLFSTTPVFALEHVIPAASNPAILSYSIIEIGRASCRERVCQYV